MTLTIDEARAVLFLIADETAGRSNRYELEAAARDFARACLSAASGVPAAKHKEERDKARGKRLCASCGAVVFPVSGQTGGFRYANEDHSFHRCGRK